MMNTKKTQKKCICSIASANYLSYVKTLADSIENYHNDVYFCVLLVDKPTTQVLSAVSETGLNVIFAEELGIKDFDHLSFKYDVIELNTALKPTFLLHLLNKDYHKIIYFDPDICLYNNVDLIFNSLDSSMVLLTPHTTEGIMDGSRPSDIDFLRSGLFNLGFVALKNDPESYNLLKWWENRCLSYGFNDVGFGTFVDQKWMDLAPIYFYGVSVFKNKGCNVSWWNLHERSILIINNKYYINETPLYFYHFSGINPLDPSQLSKNQTRHIILPGSPLERLYYSYCAKVMKNNYLEFSDLEYTYSTFSNGRRITKAARRSSCIEHNFSVNPFKANSVFYKRCLSVGFLEQRSTPINNTNTNNFNEKNIKVKILNSLIRMISFVIGINVMSSIIKYLSILNRESNLERVVLGMPFDFKHSANRTRFKK